MLDIKRDLTTINHWPDRSGHTVKAIVMHSAGGYYKGTIQWFRNKKACVSSTYLISEKGEVSLCVEESSAAWANGIVTVDKNTAPKVIRDNWGINPNLITISIEMVDKKDRNWKYPEPQYSVSVELVTDICKRYGIEPSGDTILMHKEIDPKNKVDPVGKWDHIKFVSDVKSLFLKGGEQNKAYYPLEATVEVAGFVDELCVREKPNTKAKLSGSRVLYKGSSFRVQGYIHGERVTYSDPTNQIEVDTDLWWHSSKGNYVWCGGTTRIPSMTNTETSIIDTLGVVSKKKSMNKIDFDSKLKEFQDKIKEVADRMEADKTALDVVKAELVFFLSENQVEAEVVPEGVVEMETAPVEVEAPVEAPVVEEAVEITVEPVIEAVVEEAVVAETPVVEETEAVEAPVSEEPKKELPEEAKSEILRLMEEIRTKFGLEK